MHEIWIQIEEKIIYWIPLIFIHFCICSILGFGFCVRELILRWNKSKCFHLIKLLRFTNTNYINLCCPRKIDTALVYLYYRDSIFGLVKKCSNIFTRFFRFIFGLSESIAKVWTNSVKRFSIYIASNFSVFFMQKVHAREEEEGKTDNKSIKKGLPITLKVQLIVLEYIMVKYRDFNKNSQKNIICRFAAFYLLCQIDTLTHWHRKREFFFRRGYGLKSINFCLL